MYVAYLVTGGVGALIGAFIGYSVGVLLAYEGMRALALRANHLREGSRG